MCSGDGAHYTDLFAPMIRLATEANRRVNETQYQESAVVALQRSLVTRSGISVAREGGRRLDSESTQTAAKGLCRVEGQRCVDRFVGQFAYLALRAVRAV